MSSIDDKIETFWQWFVKNERVVKECIEIDSSPNQAYVVNQMDELILDLGVFTWDIGLDDSNNWFLTVSPNGSDKYLGISQRIMLESPTHLNWNFYPSRPAKNWDRQFTVHTFDMEEVLIDASIWKFITIIQDDDSLEIVIEATNVDHLDKETAESAANQFLVGELGEELKMQRISAVSIVDKVDVTDEHGKKPISELKESIN